MPGDVALDTNAAIALLDDDPALWQRLGEAGAIALPVVVLGELIHGAMISARVGENLSRIERFAQLVDVLVCDPEAAFHYGEIRAQLRRKGRPIPHNDLWIAALAVRHGLAVVMRDAHFDEVEGLATIGW